jgi:hypothetical protein
VKKPVNLSAELVEPIWERQPNEPTDWFRRFCAYRNQVGKRSKRSVYLNEMALKDKASESIKKCFKPEARIPGSWFAHIDRWQWEERVQAWDLEKQQDEDREWDIKMQVLRSNRWNHYEAIRAKAETMLKMPIVNQTTTRNEENGLLVTNIKAADWKQFLNAAKFLAIGDKLGEAAVGNLNTAATLLQKAGFKVEPPNAIENALGFESDYAEPDDDR